MCRVRVVGCVDLQIAFTGSSATGSKIMSAAAQLVKVCDHIKTFGTQIYGSL